MPPRPIPSILRLALGAILLSGAAGQLRAQTQVQDAPAWSTPVIELNQNLPSWLRIDGQYRNRVEELVGIKFKPLNDTHDLNQLRIRLTIHPSDWLQFAVETQDARIFFNQNVGDVPPYRNTWDIREAYVQLGKPSAGWFDIVVGRQNLAFGDERLIGPSNWLNMGRTFDVARLNLHHDWFRVSLFASSVIVARDGVIDHHIEGNNLHGAYFSLSRVIPQATVEPYVMWRVAPGNIKLNENAGRGALNEVTVGVRISGKISTALDYNIEMDTQTGSLGPDSIGAWAGHWNVGKPIHARLNPRPFVEANYASGTKDPTSTKWSTFDQTYPSSHDKLGFADQVGWRNIEQIRTGVSETAGRKWKFTQTYENFWLASARDALYATSGAPAVQSLSGSAGRHVGQEIDLWAGWNWRNILEIGFGYARFFAGSYLDRVTPGKNFSYPFAYLTYHFTQTPTN